LSLESIEESTCCVVVGDFNLPMLDWSMDDAAPDNIGESTIGNALCEVEETIFDSSS
jgi:hypothetical protein